MAEITRQQIILAIMAVPRSANQRLSLAGVDLSGLDLSHFDLRGAWMSHVNLKGCKLIGADLADCMMADSDLTGADLTEAVLEDANVCHCKFTRSVLKNIHGSGILAESADFTDADMTGAHVSNGSFANAKFRMAKLINVCADESRFAGNDWLMTRVDGGSWNDLKIYDGDKKPLPFAHTLATTTTGDAVDDDDNDEDDEAGGEQPRRSSNDQPSLNVVQMLFEDVDGHPVPRLPVAVDGTARRPGEQYFSLDGAAAHFKADAVDLSTLWVRSMEDLLGRSTSSLVQSLDVRKVLLSLAGTYGAEALRKLIDAQAKGAA